MYLFGLFVCLKSLALIEVFNIDLALFTVNRFVFDYINSQNHQNVSLRRLS